MFNKPILAVLSAALLQGAAPYAKGLASAAGNQEGESDPVGADEAQAQNRIPPAAPTNLTATRLSATQIQLHWNDNSSNEIEFHIMRAASDDPWEDHHTVGANMSSWTDDADADVPYRYVVKAKKASTEAKTYPGYSAPSNEVTEDSAKVTLLAGVGRTPLPSGHPKPHGTVTLTNIPPKPDDTLSGTFSDYIPYGPPENGEQRFWQGTKEVVRPMGHAYTVDVSVDTDGKLIVPDPEHPIYDIGDLMGDASAARPSATDAMPNYHVENDRSHSSLTRHGTFTLYSGKIAGTGAGYDAATNPPWQLLPTKPKNKQVTFTLTPGDTIQNKQFSLTGDTSVSPTNQRNPPYALTLATLNEHDPDTEEMLTVSMDGVGVVGKLNVHVRDSSALAVAMLVINQVYPKGKTISRTSILATQAPAKALLEPYLKTTVFQPEANVDVTLARIDISRNYDLNGNGMLDWDDPAEMKVITDTFNEYTGYDKYLVFVHEIAGVYVHGVSDKRNLSGLAFHTPGQYAVIHDFTYSKTKVPAHELGHTLGLFHAQQEDKNPLYLPNDNWDQRLMGYGINEDHRLTHEEWKQIWKEVDKPKP